MKIIAAEEHFTTKEQIDAMRSMLKGKETAMGDPETSWVLASDKAAVGEATIASMLLDLDKVRWQQMDEAGINMQVLSLMMPGVQTLDTATGIATARIINDRITETVKQYPERFVALATMAPQTPEEAASELKRAVNKLGLRGAIINSHTGGEYLDDRKYWPIFEMAEKLDVPIYIHPRRPSPDMIKPYLTYPELSHTMCGFGAEVNLHALRLICSGVFDEYPRLKIILGHLGEALPYWLWRIDNFWVRGQFKQKLKKKASQYMKDNFYITTSGMFWQPPMLCAYFALGADNILFAVDYPFESGKLAVQFMDSLPICDSDKEKICHSNAEKLFKL